MNLKKVLTSVLDKLSFLDSQEKLSLTNLTVIVFVTFTAFRTLFAGMTIHIGSDITWTIESIDVSSTLPMLFGLGNYMHKRYVNSQNGDNS